MNVFLIPPSEGKAKWGKDLPVSEYIFEPAYDFWISASEKDLKCTASRYEEAMVLNKNLETTWELLPAAQRYSGVMYDAIDFLWMTPEGQKFFKESFLIFSGMFGVLKPSDNIWNYKLPVEAKGLAKFWKERVTEYLNSLEADVIYSFLPISYTKMIDFKALDKNFIQVNFMTEKNWKIQKMAHWVKWVKWSFIKDLCEGKISVLDFEEIDWVIAISGK